MILCDIVLTRHVFDAVRVQGQVPVEAAEREVRRFQLALGAAGRRAAVLVLERVGGRGVMVVLDLVMVVHQPGRERRGHAELGVVQRAHVTDGQLQLELAVRVREVSAVQVADRYVIPVPLGRAVRRELHLRAKPCSMISACMRCARDDRRFREFREHPCPPTHRRASTPRRSDPLFTGLPQPARPQ